MIDRLLDKLQNWAVARDNRTKNTIKDDLERWNSASCNRWNRENEEDVSSYRQRKNDQSSFAIDPKDKSKLFLGLCVIAPTVGTLGYFGAKILISGSKFMESYSDYIISYINSN